MSASGMKFTTHEAHAVNADGEMVTFRVGQAVEVLVGEHWREGKITEIYTESLTEAEAKREIMATVSFSATEHRVVQLSDEHCELRAVCRGFDLGQLLATCIEVVRRSNDVISGIYETGDLDVIDKALGREAPKTKALSDADIVDPTTRADIAAQKLIAGSLRECFPEVAICGEEGVLKYSKDDIVDTATLKALKGIQVHGVGKRTTAEGSILLRPQFYPKPVAVAAADEVKSDEQIFGFDSQLPYEISREILNDAKNKWNAEDINVWVDPLDGTKEFTEGIKSAVTTLVGVAYKGRPVAAVIGRPFHRHSQAAIIWTLVGVGAFAALDSDSSSSAERSKALGFVSAVKYERRDIESRRVICTTRSHFLPGIRNYIVACKPSGFVRSGGCGGKVLMVVEGVADAYVFPSLGTKKWDTCAVEALLLTLGGALTKPNGGVYDYGDDSPKAYMNAEGFVATCKPQTEGRYHASFLQQSLGDISEACVDCLLFGVTGFTGKMALLWILTRHGDDEDFRLAVAGRSRTKVLALLRSVVDEMVETDSGQLLYDQFGYRFSEGAIERLRIVVADAKNEAQCDAMVRQTAAIVSTVGPFAEYGENVIKSCVKYGVDYADTTGEYFWVKRMALKYECEAIRSHSRIVNCAAFVSFPVDASVHKGMEYFGARFDAAKHKMSADTRYAMSGGSQQSGGTLHTTLSAFESTDTPVISATKDYLYLCNRKPFLSRDSALRHESRTLAHDCGLPLRQPSPRVWPRYDARTRKYAAAHWYGLVDTLTVHKSNFQRGFAYGKLFEMQWPSLLLPSPAVYLYTLFVSVLAVLQSTACGRWLLRKLLAVVRWLDSVGAIRLRKPGEGAPLESEAKGKCTVYTTLRNEATAEACEVRLRMHGGAGYYLTSRMCVEYGLLFAKQRRDQKQKFKGGFFTPVGALGTRVLDEMLNYEPSYMDLEIVPI